MATKWTLDPAHSELQFKVKHLMITNVTGNINKFTVEAEVDSDNFENVKVVFTADMNSISTNDPQRDGDLRTGDFFDVEKYPEARFVSTEYSNGKLTGDLTIRDITKPVTVDVEFGGINKDPWGNTKAGFSISGKINRKDWNLTWNAPLETGGFLVGDDVRIMGEIQLVKAQ